MRGSSRTNSTGNRTRQLEEEAAAMEKKLGALKQAMAVEREKRENLKATTPSAAGFWRSSSKGTTDVRKGKPQPTSRGSSGRTPQADRPTNPSSRRPKVAASASSGASTATTRGAQQQAAEAPPQPLEDNLTVRQQRINRAPNPGLETETGMSCGTEDLDEGAGGGELFEGNVDEAANRREFLEALAAWRGGGASTSQGKQEGSTTTATAAFTSTTAGGSDGLQHTEMQTWTDPPAPTTQPSKSRPYFDKLMMEAQAKAAGEAAAQYMGCGRTNSTASGGVSAAKQQGPTSDASQPSPVPMEED